MIEEGPREAEFPWIEFRDSSVGRQAYMKGSSLAVWEVILVARHLAMDVEQTAGHFDRPTGWAQAALTYYGAHADEIDAAMDENRSMSYEELKALLPQSELIEIPRGVHADERA